MKRDVVFNILCKSLYEFGDYYVNAFTDESFDEEERDEELMDIVDGFALDLMSFFEEIDKQEV